MPDVRLLLPGMIPVTLWLRPQSLLVLPRTLAEGYHQIVCEEELLRDALSDADDHGPVGGVTEEQTQLHFARRFSGSCARLQLAVLDPKDELYDASNLFLRAFAGGRVGLLDIPCGAGASAATLLLCISELRRESVLPRHPLDIFLVAGDLSRFARAYAARLLDRFRSDLESQGIRLHVRFVDWDILNAQSTTDLLHHWADHARDCRSYFIVVSNFSGFLQSQSRLKAADSQLQEIFRWATSRRSSVIWVEPQTNEATQNFFPRLLSRISKMFRHFFSRPGSEARPEIATSSAHYRHPLREDGHLRVHLSLMRLEHHDPSL